MVWLGSTFSLWYVKFQNIAFLKCHKILMCLVSSLVSCVFLPSYGAMNGDPIWSFLWQECEIWSVILVYQFWRVSPPSGSRCLSSCNRWKSARARDKRTARRRLQTEPANKVVLTITDIYHTLQYYVTGVYISWKAVTKPLLKVKGQLGNLEASALCLQKMVVSSLLMKWSNVHPPKHVTCHVSCVLSQLSI